MTDALNSLALRCEEAGGFDNAINVLCEIALFEPDDRYLAVRANSAGTKVIYSMNDGRERTCWARDWTIRAKQRANTAAALRARAATPPEKKS